MDNLSYRRHRFPGIVIQQAVWLYFRFALSYRDVEDMLAARGIDVSYETLRRWALKFGSIIARKLRRGRPRPDRRWHLDEVFVSINGRQLYVWRAVDSEGEVLDILVQPRRDRKAALKLMRKLLKRQGITPTVIVTDKLGSYSSALRELGVARRHDTGRWKKPGREFSSAIAITRTTYEALQITWIGTALSLDPRHRLQCVQPPTSSDFPPNPARVSRSGYADMAPSDSRSVNRYGHGHSLCKFPINVTVPASELSKLVGSYVAAE
jgi:transposase-like protein